MIIGITGTNAAGKGEIAKILHDKFDFINLSCSDIIRDELKSHGREVTRDNLRETGNDLRTIHGPQVLAERVYEKILFDKESNYSVDSIRNPAEIEFFKKNAPDFILIFVDAPLDMRYKRAIARGRNGEGTSFEEFKIKEDMENTTDKNSQQLKRCADLADMRIFNDKSLQELEKEIKRAIQKG